MTTFLKEMEIRQATNQDHLRTFNELKKSADDLETQVQEWIDSGFVLHGEVIDPDKKGELLALKQDLINRLKAILG